MDPADQQSDQSSQSEDEEKRNSMIEEALKILNEEGFKLPGDVVDTLQTVSRTNPKQRKRGSLRGHRVCEVQSNTRRTRNERESSARRSQDNSRGRESSEEVERPARGANGNGASNQNPDPPERKSRRQQYYENVDPYATEGAASACSSAVSDVTERDESSESSSTCTASTVRERPHGPVLQERPALNRQDSGSSIASSASSLNRKMAQLGERRSSGSDTGYNTSIENAKQTHEARAENLKNINKHIENKLSERLNNGGLRREISRDSGFTEPGQYSSLSSCPMSPVSQGVPAVQDANGNMKKDFRDFSKTKTDVTERVVSTPQGDAHVVTSSSSDLAAAEMTSRSDEMMPDGTAVSSASKLASQETGSELARVTTKVTGSEVTKEEDYEAENRRTNSSRNDSISTSLDGVTTASSRHAASMEQNLHLEKSQLTKSTDGRQIGASMSVNEQLSRQQEVNNVEHADDGTSKSEHRQVAEKSSMSKSHREQQVKTDEGDAFLSSSQHLEGHSKSSLNEESTTNADGSVSKRKSDTSSSSMSEKTSSEKKIVKQLPYGGGSSTELIKKSDVSTSSKTSSLINEVKETPGGGRSEVSKSEDSNRMSSSFSGQCESTDVQNGQKLHRTTSSEQSSENQMTSRVSSSSYSGALKDGRERRLSNSSNASTLTNFSGLSKENIRPPSYEETMSNLSRQNSQSASSLYSRQDSCASSIASSAGAQNERERRKQYAQNRSVSGDSNTELKGIVRTRHDRPDYSHQDSFSSDSTLGGDGNRAYQTATDDDVFGDTRPRVINHPIRQTNQPAYNRSFTDSVCDRPRNRRATLHGDVVLTERELREAREEVKAKIRGKDDTYIRSSVHAAKKDTYVRPKSSFERGFGKSFGRDVIDMVERFFEDEEDDDFGFGLRSGRSVTDSRSRSLGRRATSSDYDSFDAYTPSRSYRSPYTVREDLTKLSSRDGSEDSVNVSRAASDYAASESGGFRSSNRKSRGSSYYDRDISDTVSEGGYRSREGRYSRNRHDDKYSSLDTSSDVNGRHRNDRYYHSGGTAPRSGDVYKSAGKSIGSRRGDTNSSIFTGTRLTDQDISDRAGDNSNSYVLNGSSGYRRYKNSSSEIDMCDDRSTCDSVYSLPPEVHRLRYGESSNLNDFRAQSLPDITDSSSENRGEKMSADGNKAQWNSRRERIDTALSWIRSELNGLRTQDKVLMSQFQRCQDSIEQLKKQRPWFEVFSDEEEEGEDRHWEDWEIEDFDRACMTERISSASTQSKPGATITKEYKKMSMRSTE